MIGRTLAHYEITALLGRGGMGEVYRAVDTKLGREVALKVLPAAMSGDPDRLARFVREARTVAGLNHPNIVTLHSVDEDDGVHFLTMELVEGELLGDHFVQDGLPVETLVRYAVPIAEAVAAAHAQGVVHRDLKPGNVMVTAGSGRIKVLDFGLAKAMAALDEDTVDELNTMTMTGPGGVVGTPYYMSPEQARAGEVDHRTDIFSLGVMLFEMAAGRRPFEGDSSIEVLSAVLRDDPPDLAELRSGLPDSLRGIVARCLAKAPADRYQSAADLANDLRAVGDPDASLSFVSAPPPPPPKPAPPRRRILAVAGGLVLLAAAVALVARWAPSGGDPAGEADPDRPVLAVLPFANLGQEQDAYFAEGITDEIRSRLAMIRQLGVISRTSMRAYEDTRKTVREIGDELDSDYVLEGTIRWDRTEEPGRVRITPRLVRVSDDTQVWTNSYQEEVTGIFDLQAEIARKIAEALDVTLALTERQAIGVRPTENLEAYQAFLQGLEHFRSPGFSREKFELSLMMFQRAIEIDPGFALAHARLSAIHSRLYHYGFDRTPERLALARAAADEALVLAPELPEAHLALGYYYYWGTREYAEALTALEAARVRAPHDGEIQLVTAYVKRRQGDFEAAVELFRRVQTLDPLDPNVAVGLGETYGTLRRYDEAEAAFEHAIGLAPGDFYPYTELALLYLRWRGDAAAARAVLDGMPPVSNSEACRVGFLVELLDHRFEAALAKLRECPGPVIEAGAFYIPVVLYEGMTLHLMGKDDEARDTLSAARALLETRLAESPDDPRLHSSLGLALAGLGEAGAAVRHGRRAVELYPLEEDALEAPVQIITLAMIHTMLGDEAAARVRIEEALAVPSILSTAWLEADPRWRAWDGPPAAD